LKWIYHAGRSIAEASHGNRISKHLFPMLSCKLRRLKSVLRISSQFFLEPNHWNFRNYGELPLAERVGPVFQIRVALATSTVGYALEGEVVEPNLVPEFHRPGLPLHTPTISHTIISVKCELEKIYGVSCHESRKKLKKPKAIKGKTQLLVL